MLLAENVVIADRFRLTQLIGRGGMGSVWKARDLRLDTDCAIKFIEGELATFEEAHRRFEREAKAAAQVRSPHLVQIIDHNVWEGTPYIAMELLEGEDLGHRIAREGRMAPAAIHAVMIQACRGLSKAHAAGIVHRDIKPDNLFVVQDDEREIVKILDFGIAKSSASGLEGGSNTKTGAMLGTPYYMSPEQAQGIKAIDLRSDLWSLAVIVFQAITGKLPFESEALGDLLVRIIVAPIPVPSQVAPGVPPGFDRWWAKAAAKEPDNRFQSAKEFSDALSIALGQTAGTAVIDRPQFAGTHVLQAGAGAARPLGGTPFPGGSATPVGGATQALSMGTPFPGAPPANPNAISSPGFATPYPGGPPSMAGTIPLQTFSGTDVPAGTARKSSLALVAVALAVVGLLGAGGVGLLLLRKAPTEPPTVTTTVATTAPSTPPVPTPSSTPSAAPTEVASSEPAPAPTDSAAKPASTHGVGGGKPAAPRPAGSASTKPSGAKPKPADLGF